MPPSPKRIFIHLKQNGMPNSIPFFVVRRIDGGKPVEVPPCFSDGLFQNIDTADDDGFDRDILMNGLIGSGNFADIAHDVHTADDFAEYGIAVALGRLVFMV